VLVTFKTSAFADITMFGSVATTLLKMMGQSGNVPGALLAEDLPAALQNLNTALAEAARADSEHSEDMTGMAPASDPVLALDEDEDDMRPVPIATRAGPLLELLEAARAAKQNVLWEE